jgi:hypothetical protein
MSKEEVVETLKNLGFEPTGEVESTDDGSDYHEYRSGNFNQSLFLGNYYLENENVPHSFP